MSKKILVSDGNGKHQEISENYISVDVDNNSISASILVANTASILNSSTNKPVFIQNNVLTTIADPSAANKFIKYTNADGFTTADVDTSALQGDLSGAFPTEQIKVTSVANVTGGILPLAYGGLGTGSYTNAGLITTGGSFNLKSDNSINANQMTLVKGVITTAPAGLFGGNALSSSYDATAGGPNYTAKVDINSYVGDFTNECWINLANIGNNPADANGRCAIFGYSNNNYAVMFSGTAGSNTGLVSLWYGNGTTVTNLQYTASNGWQHIAFVRSGDVLKLYLNGTGSANIAATTTTALTTIFLGTNGDPRWNINGFMTEVSMVKYAKTDNEIKGYYNAVRASPSTTRLNSGSITNSYDTLTGYKPTALATLTASSAIDNSLNANTITFPAGANFTTAPVGLFGGNALSSSYNADGTKGTCYITLAQSHAGNFTIESWVNLANKGTAGDGGNKSTIFGVNGNLFNLALSDTNLLSFYDGSGTQYITDLTFTYNQWNHVALVRNNNEYRIYLNGTASSDVYTTPIGIATLSTLHVGTPGGGNYAAYNVNGYITEYSMVKYAKTATEIKSYYNEVRANLVRLNANSTTYSYDISPYISSVLANLSASAGHGPNRILKYSSSNTLETVSKSSIEEGILTEPIAYLYTGSIATNNTAQVDTFSWTKPKGCRFVKVYCQAAGGAGANARPDSSGTAFTSGFYGGGGGGLSIAIFNALALPGSVTVSAGRGGYVNPLISTSPPVNGKGGNSSFGAYLIAYGGTEGFTSTANTRPGYGGIGYSYNGGDGSNRASGPGVSVVLGGAGGGGGGRGGAGSATAGGSITGASLVSLSNAVGQTGKLITSTVFSKYYLNNVLTFTDLPNLLCAGGYGGASTTNYAENGVSPTFGSGGGGGGDSLSAGFTGTGGNGGKGYVLIICY